VILLGVAIHFTRRSLAQQRTSFETRLKLLRNQLHPHMLFNSLNTIYGLSLQQSDKTPGLILNLSNMLDYMLYQCDTDKIILKKEIEFLKNYIEIEKHRFSEDLHLNIEWPEGDDQYLIAPLLLLPIVENCFKHTRHIRDISPEIYIECLIRNGKLHFVTRNSYRKNEKSSETEGIGIRNLKERLALLYPGKNDLKNSIQNNQYIAELILELDTIKQE
jgi:LytS/YehU family sensor histidine kinase